VNELDTNRLSELIGAKLKMVELLAQLARRQLALVEAGETSDLLKLLAAKQSVLARMQEVERLLDPFREQDPDARVWRSVEDRSRSQDQARRCDELLAETMRLEKEGEAGVVRRRDAAAAVLASARAAADVQAAYAAPLAPPPIQLHCEG
jgi:hypothetical protein